MLRPKYLRAGDQIGIVSPARWISKDRVETAIRIFEDWELKVVCGKHLYDADHQYAGTDEERAADLQQMLDDDAIRAIVCSRGGYGTVRIVDRLDFSRFQQRPKWIVGYSDVTVIHSHIQHNYAVETLHATMPINMKDQGADSEAVHSLKKALFGTLEGHLSSHHPLNRNGFGKGALVGGNLSILYGLSGTASDIETEGKILFLEDLDEYLYHIDRMMMQLKRSGKLDKLTGLIVGGMTDMNDNKVPFGKTAYEIIHDAVAEYDYPVCFNFPAGHIPDNRALILGREIELEVGDKIRLGF